VFHVLSRGLEIVQSPSECFLTDSMTILYCLRTKEEGYIKLSVYVCDWIDLTEDREQWRTLVDTVINLRGSIKCWEVLE
jgi:hypothetical protein